VSRVALLVLGDRVTDLGPVLDRVARWVASGAGRDLDGDPRVTRLVAELAAAVADGCRNVDGSPRVWMTTSEAAARLGRPVRTVRWQAAEGRIPARREGGRWRVQLPEP
jgi:excisionase family DNA binding protein